MRFISAFDRSRQHPPLGPFEPVFPRFGHLQWKWRGLDDKVVDLRLAHFTYEADVDAPGSALLVQEDLEDGTEFWFRLIRIAEKLKIVVKEKEIRACEGGSDYGGLWSLEVVMAGA